MNFEERFMLGYAFEIYFEVSRVRGLYLFKLYLILFFCQSIFVDHINVLYSDMGKIYINSYDKYPYMHTQFQSC